MYFLDAISRGLLCIKFSLRFDFKTRYVQSFRMIFLITSAWNNFDNVLHSQYHHNHYHPYS